MMLSYIMCIISYIGDTLRTVGRNWSDYWNQVLGKIFSSPISAKEPPDTIISRTKKYHSSKRLLLLGLMDASNKAPGVPNIDLRGYSMLKMKLKKFRDKDGQLNICKLSDFGLQKVISVLESLP